jgi:hypothetical protein
MKRLVLVNAFSVNMLPAFVDAKVDVKEVSRDEFVKVISELRDLPRMSVIGHKATAEVLSQILGFPVAENRVNYIAEDGDIIAVFVPGVRLEEGKILSTDELANFPGRYFFVRVNLQK